jgi:valyl-tRNA synthetase
MSKIELAKTYEASKFEDDIYRLWEESGLFNPDNLNVAPDAKSYTIILPPPNITDKLHLGHAAMLAIEDLFIRYKRLQGFRTLWLPGTDHAAIATQTVVEKKIKQELGQSRHDLGREQFLNHVWAFLRETQTTILKQIRVMGASLDWSRLAFTLDEPRREAVQAMFIKMYEAGLIYRGERVVNWCPRCQSTLADDEVEYQEQSAKLYTFRYDLDFPIAISTTRPETKLGDTAVAVNPRDARYKKFIGQTLEADFCGVKLKLKIIADRNVDKDFGTGALGVTPAHSMADSQMATANDLPAIKVINEQGLIHEGFGAFSGLKVEEARDKIVEELKVNNLLDKEEDIANNLSVCYRCATAIEPLPSKQWFIAVDKKIKELGNKSLKDRAKEVVEEGEIKFVPERFNKRYLDWMDNLRDWCISRQIWFGHSLPVWYDIEDFHNKEGDIYFKPNTIKLSNAQWDKMGQRLRDRTVRTVANGDVRYVKFDVAIFFIKSKWYDWKKVSESIKAISTHNCTKPRIGNKVGPGLEIQDSDTLDTWFSSGMWTFSTLGWPHNFKDNKKSGDLAKFHPTQLMETGYEIITLWVSRMIMMSLFAVGEVPFETVYLHGMVLDKQGKKMSKSKGNGIDPMDMVKLYGADAVRLSLLIGVTPGTDFRMSEDKIGAYRNFVNKFWNISRFILLNIDKPVADLDEPKAVTLFDQWILDKLANLTASVSASLDKHDFALAGEQLQKFTWDDLADWYLEVAKVEGDKAQILNYILNTLLKLWHPFMPFVTEAVWQEVYQGQSLLLVERWPEGKAHKKNAGQNEIDLMQKIIVGIRNARSANKLEPSLAVKAVIYAGEHLELLQKHQEIIRTLRTSVGELIIKDKGEAIDEAIYFSEAGVEVYLVAQIDKGKEKLRLEKEFVKLEEYITVLEAKLANEEFMAKAPQALVDKEQAKLSQAQSDLAKIKERLELW